MNASNLIPSVMCLAAVLAWSGCTTTHRAGTYRFVDAQTGHIVHARFVFAYTGGPPLNPDPIARQIMLWAPPDPYAHSLSWIGSGPLTLPVEADGYEYRDVDLTPGDHTVELTPLDKTESDSEP